MGIFHWDPYTIYSVAFLHGKHGSNLESVVSIMIKKFVPFLALISAGSYLAGRYDLWWVAVIYSGVLYWLFFLRK
jgi:hypothetical protein